MSDPLEIVAAIRLEMEAAVDAILVAVTDGLGAVSDLGPADNAVARRLEAGLLQILEACAFQDLTGQRLSSLAAALNGAKPSATPANPLGRTDALLNGPALAGQGVDQAAADRILSDF